MNENENDGMNQLSEADQTVDYTELIAQDAFIGEYPFDSIIEGIDKQFSSYMTTTDRTDYVEAFYSQLHTSYKVATVEDEEHPRERIDVLNDIHDKFIMHMAELFEHKLNIVVSDIEAEDIDQDKIERIFTLMYDFFILNAPSTFHTVILKYMENTLASGADLEMIEHALDNFNPLVLCMEPQEFIQLSGNRDLYDLFDDFEIAGNFLTKFTPRLYVNEEYKVNLVNDIIIQIDTTEG